MKNTDRIKILLAMLVFASPIRVSGRSLKLSSCQSCKVDRNTVEQGIE